jgi:hypothetical protein
MSIWQDFLAWFQGSGPGSFKGVNRLIIITTRVFTLDVLYGEVNFVLTV